MTYNQGFPPLFLLLFVLYLFMAQDICKYEQITGRRYGSYPPIVFIAIWNDDVGFTYCDGAAVGPRLVLTLASCFFSSQRMRCHREVSTGQYFCNNIGAENYEVVAGRNVMIGPNPADIVPGLNFTHMPRFRSHHDYGYNVAFLKTRNRFRNNMTYNVSAESVTSFYYDQFPYCSLLFFGQTSCTTTFRKNVRQNRYSFSTDDTFQGMQSLNVTRIVTAAERKSCDDLYNQYMTLGYNITKSEVFCAKADIQLDDCQYFHGATLWCSNRIEGIAIEQLSCLYKRYPLLFIRMGHYSQMIDDFKKYSN